jgi:serine/threonine protein kinase
MLAPNTILQGRYRVVRQLGQGGMGTVYEAVDQRFESQVALKETLFSEESLRKQFEREARLLNKLRHPAMTRVIDHFTEGAGQFLVMDFVEGEDLWEMLQRRGNAFPLEQVMRWGEQLLDALDYIHTQPQPIIHRDIKPQNLKLTARGQIVLLDFGLAKGSTGHMTTVVTSRSVLGYSLAYAPPEQILKVEQHWVDLLSVSNADEVQEILRRGTDARSDLYSLGATLLHLLTGKTPPNAPTRALSVWSNRADPLEAAFDDNVPGNTASALKKAMALTMEERYGSAAEMLLAWRGVEPPAATETKIRPEPTAQSLPPTIVSPAPRRKIEAREESLPAATIASPPPPSLSSEEPEGEPAWETDSQSPLYLRVLMVGLIILIMIGLIYIATRKGEDEAAARGNTAVETQPQTSPADTPTMDPRRPTSTGDGIGSGSGSGIGSGNGNGSVGDPGQQTNMSTSPIPKPTVAVRLTPVWPGGVRDPASYASVTAFVEGRKKEFDKTLGSATYIEFTVDCDQTIDVWVRGGYDSHGYHPYIPCDKPVVNIGNLLIGTRRYSPR